VKFWRLGIEQSFAGDDADILDGDKLYRLATGQRKECTDCHESGKGRGEGEVVKERDGAEDGVGEFGLVEVLLNLWISVLVLSYIR
jgi:hypothetical protein